MSNLISSAEICEWLGYARDADVARWLQRHRIPYWYGKNHRPVTTQTAIDRVLIGEEGADEIEFEGPG